MSIWDDLLWRDEELVAADLETSGRQKEYALQPWRMARGDMWITSASMIRFDAQQGLIAHLSQLFPRREQLRQMLEDVIANGWTILGWNLAFDISCLMALGPDIADLCMRAKWLDGMLMWRHYDIEPEYEFQTRKDKKKSYSLKGYTDDSGTVRTGAVQEFIPTFAGLDEDVDFHATDPASLAKLQRYNDRDNVRAWTICKIIWGKLAPRQRRAVLIQAECLPVVAQGNLLGLVVDRLTVHHLAAKLDLDAAARLFELAPDGMTEEIVRSPAKLGALMFNPMNPTPEELAQGVTPGWQLPVLKENKSKVEGKPNTRSTDKEVLHELSFVDPRAAKIKAYREALNARGKFCESVIESLDYNGDGRTHPVARLFGTYTGRMTVASKQGRGTNAAQIGFALHQMKRGKEFREIITVEDGFDIVEFDAAGQEFRWMAIASNDPTMLTLCQPGEDAHSHMGAEIMGVPYRKLMADVHAGLKSASDNRYLGKFANLSCLRDTSPVLTSRGYVSIDKVRADDLLWDGLEWVAHGGVVFQGMKPVIVHDEIEATVDHRVMVDGDWWELADAKRLGRRLDSAFQGVDRAAQEAWALHCRDRQAPTAAEAYQRNASTLHQSQRPELSQLRRARDRVSVFFHGCRRLLDFGASPAHGLHWAGHRSEGQRRPLRGRELAAHCPAGEPEKYPQDCRDGRGSSVGARLRTVHRADCTQDAALAHDARTDHHRSGAGGSRAAEGLACNSEPVAVYDILDAGPRNRFTVNGRIVHNCQYRTSARKLRSKARVDYDIPLEMPAALRIHATYQRTYPGVPAYWEHQIALVKGLGYVETFDGSRIKVEGDWNGTWGWSMGSTAINARIQGTGAGQKHLAIAVIKDYLRQIGGRFMFDLHDGLFLAVPSAIRPKAVDVMKQMLDNLPYQKAWGFSPPIPMPWDCKHGKAWGRLVEQKFA